MASRDAALPSLVVHNLPDGVDQEKIKIYFLLSKNGGSGDVEDVTYPLDGRSPNSARVTFINASTVRRICSGERKMQGTTLRLEAENVQQKQEPLITAVVSKEEQCGATKQDVLKDQEKLVRYTACRTHSDEFRRAVCSTCKDEPLICFRCMLDAHKGHDFISLEGEVETKMTDLDNLVSGDSGLDSTMSDMKVKLSRTKDKLKEAEQLRSGDVENLTEVKEKALTALKEELNKLIGLVEKDFDARQKAVSDQCATAQRDLETKWKAKTVKIEASVKALADKIKDMSCAMGDYQDLTKPFDLTVLRNVKTEVEDAMKGLTDLKVASDRAVVSPVRPVDLSKYSSMTVEVVDKAVARAQPPPAPKVSSKEVQTATAAPPPSVPMVKKATPSASHAGNTNAAAAASTSRPRGPSPVGNTAQEPSALLVFDVPKGIDDTDLEVLFNSRKGGGCGNVEYVQFPVHVAHNRTAKIFFEYPGTIISICSKPRKYYSGENVKLEPEYCA